ncbi:tudor domain-containing protein 3-like [Branchiostoma floridae]|uniref:Survival of motor neuron-related-splicing factor 30 n=1 Tax=Branchiostoma floridae TaxID=7739 RepID=A0A9J7LGD9_BRAFL|nr:tudor domain-containing protein 3-like [Branchiostoma floridae]
MAAEAAVLWKQGWHLSAEGIAALKQENNITTIDGIVRKALDEDLRSIGEKFLPEDISRGGSSELIGPCVLQVTKVRNVSAPKANEESGHAPRMLKVQMTDGHTTCIGLEVAQVQQLSLSTPPGTKVKLTGSIAISNGFLMLEGSNVKVLGGQVEKLFSRWDIQRKLAHHSRANVKVEGGAPPFVPFGQRVSGGAVATKDLRNKKSLPKKETESEEADEFSEQRKAVIAEVSKSKEGTKTFGGTGSLPATAVPEKKWGGPADRRGENRPQGVYRELSNESSQVEEKSVQKLVEMGFSRQDSVASLRQNSGDVQEAINTLVTRQGQGQGQGRDRPDRGHRGQREDRGRGENCHSECVMCHCHTGDRQGTGDRGRTGAEVRTVTQNVSCVIVILILVTGRGQGTEGGRGQSKASTVIVLFLSRRQFTTETDWIKLFLCFFTGRGRGRRGRGDEEEEDVSTRPSGPATLFDFILESKIDNLKIDDSKPSPGAQTSQPPRYNKPQGGRENHYDGQGWPQVGDSQFYGQRNNNDFRGQRNQPGGRQQYDHQNREGGQHFNDSRPYDGGRGSRGGRGRGGRHDRGGGGRGRGTGGTDSNYNRGYQEDVGRGRKGDNRQDNRQNFDEFGRQREDSRSNGPHGRHDNYRDARRGGGEQGNRPGNRDAREQQRGGKTENQEFRGQNNDSYRDHRRNEPNRQQEGGNPRRPEFRGQNEHFQENQRDGYHHRGDRNNPKQQHQDFQENQRDGYHHRGDRNNPRPQHQDRNDGRRMNNRQGSYEDRGGGQRQGADRTNQPRHGGDGGQRKWRRNDHCLARYWEDGKFYPAMVTDVAPNGRTAVVLFTEYENYEEVEMFNIRPLHGGGWMDSPDPVSTGVTPSANQKYEPYQGDINTTLEFHRSGDRRRPPQDRAQSAPTHGRGPREQPKEPKKPSRPALPIYQPPAKKKQSPE